MDQESQVPNDEASEIKLTAFALGELSEAERSEFLAQSLDAAADLRSVAEIARLGELVRRVRREEPCPERSSDLRQALEKRLAEAAPPKVAPAGRNWPSRRYWLPLSLAASVLVIAGAVMGLMKLRHNDPQQVANARLHGIRQDVGVDLTAQSLEDAVELATSDAAEAGDGESGQGQNSQKQITTESWDSPQDVAASKSLAEMSVGMDLEDASATDSLPLGASPGSGQGAGSGNSAFVPIQDPRATAGFGGASIKPAFGGGDAATSPRSAMMRGSGGMLLPSSGQPQVQYVPQNSGSFSPSTSKPAAARSPSGPGVAGFDALKRKGDRGKLSGGTLVGGRGLPPEVQAGGMSGGMGGGQQAPEGFMGLSGALQDRKSSERESGRRPRASSWFSDASGESYAPIVENPFLKIVDSPLSTFSIDVDTASYANVRRFLNSNTLPPADAVRIEELVNYFSYDYPQPEAGAPFSVHTEVAGCPWNAEHRLLKVGLKGREIAAERRPASNLVFLLDVSGSMNQPNKLPLVKEAMLLLTEQLDERDRVAIVVYADQSELALPSTSGADKRTIETAVSALSAGGSTNGGQGIQTAYETARTHFIKDGVNRVILATDGDFNVGVTDQDELVRLIEEQARGGVFFSALGFGDGNLKDGTLEKLADKGNGNYAYIDTLGEARKALVDQLSGTLVTIAKDVKVQIEFNPAQVSSFRLIGYENRMLAAADFNDDRKDAGEIGAGHTVTALYELVPARAAAAAAVDVLKYQRAEPAFKPAAESGELLTLKLRYKQPDGDKSRLLEHVVADEGKRYGQASRDFKFAASVAAFGMLLRHSSHAGDANFDAVLELAGEGLDSDLNGYRAEFIGLAKKAKKLSK
ncbi:MAG TPA: VWA domain-containing protein [Pirellulales bacterium]|nr:VWA domain-containing protein [Pirellulales bacterium]